MAISRTRRRILIGAGCFADADAAIRLVDRIVATLPAELGGVFVDEDLMADLVRWPGQRIVTSAGSLMVPPSGAEIRTLMESDARAFRNKLAAIARARSLKWSFERRGGDLIRRAFEAATGWDILLLGHREMHRRPGQVVVATVDPPGSERAGNLAGELAQALKTEVLALSIPMARHGSEVPGPYRIAVEDTSALFARLGRINAAAVVIDLAASPVQTEDQLRQLLEAARCPVVVLGAEQFRPSIEHSTIIPQAPRD